MWIKYWFLWAWGDTSKNPHYKEVKSMKEFEQKHIERLCDEYGGHSDKFRGMEYVKVRKPPKKFLQTQINYLEAQIQECKNKLVRYRTLLKK